MAGIQLCFLDESMIGVLFVRWLNVDSRRYFFLVFFATDFADGGLSGSFGLSLITNSPNWKEIKSSDIISRSRILLATLAARWGGVAEKTLHSFWRWTTSIWKRWKATFEKSLLHRQGFTDQTGRVQKLWLSWPMKIGFSDKGDSHLFWWNAWVSQMVYFLRVDVNRQADQFHRSSPFYQTVFLISNEI